MKVQAEREVQWAIEGPQAPSCEDVNIVVIKANPGPSNHNFWVYFYSSFILLMILGFILGYMSWSGTLVALRYFSIYPCDSITRDRSLAMTKCRYKLR
jgi:hypothetical protein